MRALWRTSCVTPSWCFSDKNNVVYLSSSPEMYFLHSNPWKKYSLCCLLSWFALGSVFTSAKPQAQLSSQLLLPANTYQYHCLFHIDGECAHLVPVTSSGSLLILQGASAQLWLLLVSCSYASFNNNRLYIYHGAGCLKLEQPAGCSCENPSTLNQKRGATTRSFFIPLWRCSRFIVFAQI